MLHVGGYNNQTPPPSIRFYIPMWDNATFFDRCVIWCRPLPGNEHKISNEKTKQKAENFSASKWALTSERERDRATESHLTPSAQFSFRWPNSESFRVSASRRVLMGNTWGDLSPATLTLSRFSQRETGPFSLILERSIIIQQSGSFRWGPVVRLLHNYKSPYHFLFERACFNARDFGFSLCWPIGLPSSLPFEAHHRCLILRSFANVGIQMVFSNFVENKPVNVRRLQKAYSAGWSLKHLI